MKAIIEESAHHLRERFRLRALEWQNACISVGFGVVVLINPSLFNAPSFAGFVGGPIVWGWAVLLIGFAGIGALIVNGTVPKPTAALRTISALVQVVLFLMLVIGFVSSGSITTGITTYGILAVFGFFAACWALLDAVAPEYER